MNYVENFYDDLSEDDLKAMCEQYGIPYELVKRSTLNATLAAIFEYLQSRNGGGNT